VQAMLELAPERNGWKPKVVRTVATEDRGVPELMQEIAEFRKHFEGSPARAAKKVEYWKRRLVERLEQQLFHRAIPGGEGAPHLDACAVEVAERRKDPITAVQDLLRDAGL